MGTTRRHEPRSPLAGSGQGAASAQTVGFGAAVGNAGGDDGRRWSVNGTLTAQLVQPLPCLGVLLVLVRIPL